MLRWLLACGLLLSATIAAADGIRGTDLRVIDGDTLALGDERIRLLDIDTPETHSPRCRAEAEAGREAARALRLLLAGAAVKIERHGTDRYRRTLARIYVDGRDVGVMMVEAGLAVVWRPGPEAYAERLARWSGAYPGN